MMMFNSPTAQQDCTFFDLAQQRNVIFYHMGYFSHHIISAMAEVVKLQLEISGVSGPTRRKLFSSFVELSQNIIHYSSDALSASVADESGLRQGAVCISSDGERHLMLCANPIATVDIDKVTLRAETPEDSKGAGLGFLTMARDACAPLEFGFHPRADDPDTTLFCLKATI
jgi:hypothetical protein